MFIKIIGSSYSPTGVDCAARKCSTCSTWGWHQNTGGRRRSMSGSLQSALRSKSLPPVLGVPKQSPVLILFSEVNLILFLLIKKISTTLMWSFQAVIKCFYPMVYAIKVITRARAVAALADTHISCGVHSINSWCCNISLLYRPLVKETEHAVRDRPVN